MSKKYTLSLILAVLLIGIILFISPKQQTLNIKQSDKLQVATSFYPLYFFSSAIGGDKANVINLTPAATEPHDYEPTAQDIKQIDNSNLLILNGGGLEAWSNNIKQNINPNYTQIVTAGADLANQQTIENGQSILDPHFWLSPPLAEKMVDKITAGFIQVDPINQDYYLSNSNILKNKLDELDTAYKQGLQNCAQKNIITSHSAFGYLAATYGLNQISITGLSPDSEPSPKQLADIVKFVTNNNVKNIFFESLVSPKLSDTIANEVGAKTLVLNPIEGLTKDEIKQGQDYFTEMQTNLVNLQIALECQK